MLKLIDKISDKRLVFQGEDVNFSELAMAVLCTIAQALIEYPEIRIVVEGHSAKATLVGPSEQRLLQLSTDRAEACKYKLLELGCVCNITTTCLGLSATSHTGFVIVRPQESALMSAIDRLAFVLDRSPLIFEEGAATFTAQGESGLDAIAVALRELPKSQYVLVCCKDVPYFPDYPNISARSSDLAWQRLRLIQSCLIARGVDKNTIHLHEEFSECANAKPSFTMSVYEVSRKPTLQTRLNAATEGLRFMPGSATLVRDSRISLRQAAELLIQEAEPEAVMDHEVLVEVYALRPEASDRVGAVARRLAAERADLIVQALQQEGVREPCRSQAAAFAEGRGGRVYIMLEPTDLVPTLREVVPSDPANSRGCRFGFAFCVS